MKFTFNREEFLASFQQAAAIAPSRSTKTILEFVKLEATEHRTQLLATDMEIAIRTDVSGIEASQPGSVLLPVSRLGSFFRECRDETLELEHNGESVVVKSKAAKVSFQAQNPDEFPSIVDFDAEDFFQLSSKRLKELIRRTVFATDVESSRYALGGVLFEFGSETVTGVATDGRRLARMEVALDKKCALESDSMTIVPTNNLQLMERALPDDEIAVDLAVRTNDLLCRVGGTTIFSRLVDGRFPKWREVFPERTSASKAQVNVGLLQSAIRQAAVVANAESRGVDFQFANGSLVLTLISADVGESRIEMPIEYEGNEVVIALDFRYVSDFLKVLDPESSIEVELESEEAAALFQTDDGYGYVVMPLSRDRM